MPNVSTDPKPALWCLILLLAPFVSVMWVPFFNRVGGVPFFFWYQFVWFVILMAFAYLNTAPRLRPAMRRVHDNIASG
jgi:hypothetical protein